MLEQFNTREYKQSRIMYVAECAFEYFISLLMADVFLAKILTYMGISDSVIGIISSLISISFVFQMATVFLMKKVKNIKRNVIFFDTMSHIFFMIIYLLPFVRMDIKRKTTVVILCILTAYFLKYIVSSVKYKWANSFVEPGKRGEYSGIKEIVSLLFGMVFSFSMGYMIDRYEAAEKIKIAFIVIAIIILVLNIFNFLSLFMIKKEENEEQIQSKNISDILKNTLGYKNFRNIVILTSFWDIARYMTISFMGTYKTNDLLISVGLIQIINTIASVIRIGVTIPFGKFADKRLYAKCMELAYLIVALAFAINIFTTPNRWWVVIIFTVIYEISQAGIGQNATNILYSYVKSDYIVYAMVVRNSIGSVLGFCASLVGSCILTAVQNNNNIVLGIPMHGQQLLSAISLLIMIIAVVFDRYVVEKQTVFKQ